MSDEFMNLLAAVTRAYDGTRRPRPPLRDVLTGKAEQEKSDPVDRACAKLLKEIDRVRNTKRRILLKQDLASLKKQLRQALETDAATGAP